MVLFDESPVSLIRETTSQFHITPDKSSLARISTSLTSLSTLRSSTLSTQHTSLSTLTRKLHSLQSTTTFETERHDAGKHAQEMLRMDTEKFKVAKAVTEVEVEGERLEGEVRGMKGVLEGLEREGVEGGVVGGRKGARARQSEEDEVVLRLQFYRSLGIDVTKDEETGQFRRAIVRNPVRGDVNVVNVDGSMSRTFYANMCWESL